VQKSKKVGHQRNLAPGKGDGRFISHSNISIKELVLEEDTDLGRGEKRCFDERGGFPKEGDRL